MAILRVVRWKKVSTACFNTLKRAQTWISLALRLAGRSRAGIGACGSAELPEVYIVFVITRNQYQRIMV
ncbi:MAG: hypothetical protein COB86_09400 [Dehalococcoidia bacterium]|nr:MAG: hypothetical protein COB86_09400 [Dehalococcoidia bacterium]PCI18749.1 MAG: hypothetical protein COB68_06805 [SAR202 cluster bacterium]